MGLLSCAKHFLVMEALISIPTLALPVVLRSKDTLRAIDLYPFITAKGRGKCNHDRTLNPAICSMFNLRVWSKVLITELLKRGLGFKGIVMTDALDMAAIRDIEDAAIKAINAGAGLLLHPSDPDETVEKFIMGLKKGRIALDVIEGAIKGVAKKRKGRIKGQPYDLTSVIDYGYHRGLSQKVSERSITS